MVNDVEKLRSEIEENTEIFEKSKLKKAEFERQKSEVDQTYKFLTVKKQEVERELAHFKIK